MVAANSLDIHKEPISNSDTGQHIMLLTGFGVQKIIVAISKMDVVKWDPTPFHKIK